MQSDAASKALAGAIVAQVMEGHPEWPALVQMPAQELVTWLLQRPALTVVFKETAAVASAVMTTSAQDVVGIDISKVLSNVGDQLVAVVSTIDADAGANAQAAVDAAMDSADQSERLAFYESGRFPKLRGITNTVPWLWPLAGLTAIALFVWAYLEGSGAKERNVDHRHWRPGHRRGVPGAGPGRARSGAKRRHRSHHADGDRRSAQNGDARAGHPVPTPGLCRHRPDRRQPLRPQRGRAARGEPGGASSAGSDTRPATSDTRSTARDTRPAASAPTTASVNITRVWRGRPWPVRNPFQSAAPEPGTGARRKEEVNRSRDRGRSEPGSKSLAGSARPIGPLAD